MFYSLNRTFMELKRSTYSYMVYAVIVLSNLYGIETRQPSTFSVLKVGLNRTFMELKQ